MMSWKVEKVHKFRHCQSDISSLQSNWTEYKLKSKSWKKWSWHCYYIKNERVAYSVYDNSIVIFSQINSLCKMSEQSVLCKYILVLLFFDCLHWNNKNKVLVWGDPTHATLVVRAHQWEHRNKGCRWMRARQGCPSSISRPCLLIQLVQSGGVMVREEQWNEE